MNTATILEFAARQSNARTIRTYIDAVDANTLEGLAIVAVLKQVRDASNAAMLARAYDAEMYNDHGRLQAIVLRALASELY